MPASSPPAAPSRWPVIDLVDDITSFDAWSPNVALSSTKSMTGHLLGAAGAIEAIFCILAIRDQVAPPTINLDNPERDTALNLVRGKGEPMEIDVAMSNSFGFGGTNASVIFRKVA